MKDIRADAFVKLAPGTVYTPIADVIKEAHRTNWRSDGLGGKHLVQRRIAMSQVIDYCVGSGLDVGCQANKMLPTNAVGGSCIGIDHDRRETFMFPKTRWTVDEWGDGQKLRFEDNEFDWVFAGHVLEDQTFPTGANRMLSEFYRVVKNGGYVITLTPHKLYYPNVGHPDANQAHQRDWMPEELLDFVCEILDKLFEPKFQIVQLESFYNHFEFDAVFRVMKDGNGGRNK